MQCAVQNTYVPTIGGGLCRSISPWRYQCRSLLLSDPACVSAHKMPRKQHTQASTLLATEPVGRTHAHKKSGRFLLVWDLCGIIQLTLSSHDGSDSTTVKVLTIRRIREPLSGWCQFDNNFLLNLQLLIESASICDNHSVTLSLISPAYLGAIHTVDERGSYLKRWSSPMMGRLPCPFLDGVAQVDTVGDQPFFCVGCISICLRIPDIYCCSSLNSV